MTAGYRPLVQGTSMNTEIRCKIEYRTDEDRQSPGRLTGVLMPYGTQASDRMERFTAGSLHWPPGGIILNESHDRKSPIIRITPEERDGAVYIDVRLPDTMRGRDAATSVRNCTLQGLSVEFMAEAEDREAGIRVITRAALLGAGLVTDPSYVDAAVQIRHKKLWESGRRLRWVY